MIRCRCLNGLQAGARHLGEACRAENKVRLPPPASCRRPRACTMASFFPPQPFSLPVRAPPTLRAHRQLDSIRPSQAYTDCKAANGGDPSKCIAAGVAVTSCAKSLCVPVLSVAAAVAEVTGGGVATARCSHPPEEVR